MNRGNFHLVVWLTLCVRVCTWMCVRVCVCVCVCLLVAVLLFAFPWRWGATMVHGSNLLPAASVVWCCWLQVALWWCTVVSYIYMLCCFQLSNVLLICEMHMFSFITQTIFNRDSACLLKVLEVFVILPLCSVKWSYTTMNQGGLFGI